MLTGFKVATIKLAGLLIDIVGNGGEKLGDLADVTVKALFQSGMPCRMTLQPVNQNDEFGDELVGHRTADERAGGRHLGHGAVSFQANLSGSVFPTGAWTVMELIGR